MKRNGFALIEILLVVVVLGLLVGGGWYVSHLQNEQSMIKTGINAEEQARQAVRQADQQAGQEQNILNQISATTSSISKSTSSVR